MAMLTLRRCLRRITRRLLPCLLFREFNPESLSLVVKAHLGCRRAMAKQLTHDPVNPASAVFGTKPIFIAMTENIYRVLFDAYLININCSDRDLI